MDERRGDRRGDAARAARSGRLRIGISACLLGERVRWNGDHKRDRFLVEEIGRIVEFVPVCPELELGLGSPRPPVQLERDGARVRLVEVESRRDLTRRMEQFAARRVKELAALDLCGFVLKRESPSCGLAGVKVWQRGRIAARDGRGKFAAALLAALPDLPVEEEGRLEDPLVRASFFERAHAWRRLAEFFVPRWTRTGLSAFHADEESLLRAHDPDRCRALGRLVSARGKMRRGEIERGYRAGFMAALHRRSNDRA